MADIDDLKRELVSATQELVHKGFLMATGGNISIRLAEKGLFAITPSDFDYLKMKSADVCLLDMDLKQIEGPHKPSGGNSHALCDLSGTPGCACHHPHPPGLRQRADPDQKTDPRPVRRTGALPGAKRGDHSLRPLRDGHVEINYRQTRSQSQ